MRNSIRLTVLAAAALAFSTTAFAVNNQQSNFTVTATVASDCTITAATMTFGNYFVVANASKPLDNQNTSISYSCPLGVTAKIVLDQGTNQASGSTLAVPLRQMAMTVAETTTFLAYNLYSDAPGGLVFDGVTGIGSLAGTGSTAVLAVKGRVAEGQTPPAGNYTDTVIATITYF